MTPEQRKAKARLAFLAMVGLIGAGVGWSRYGVLGGVTGFLLGVLAAFLETIAPFNPEAREDKP